MVVVLIIFAEIVVGLLIGGLFVWIKLRIRQWEQNKDEFCPSSPALSRTHTWSGPHELARGFDGCIWCGRKRDGQAN